MCVSNKNTRFDPGVWCRDWESDPGHHNFQSCALPTELSRQVCLFYLRGYSVSSSNRFIDQVWNQNKKDRLFLDDVKIFFPLAWNS